MSWERDFEGIPIKGKRIVYSFLFSFNKINHTYETIFEASDDVSPCHWELTAKRRYGRYLKKFGDIKLAELISFWMYVWEDGELIDDKIIYHFRGLHEE